ncbi:MAG: 30S ribosomal protein S19 [Candidatus Nanopusillus acidilobi]|jgi:small subunit ribosomal protein S19|nr:30S ribosomal protein S19 [Candidatus Nanopusillus sp.]MCG2868667.1 30S ribosomal protein S19 [Candidatus Nanopusillus sp.]MCG2882913.1 30S ribosomal protein S19 [Candidatus Nanopusillus sp.]
MPEFMIRGYTLDQLKSMSIEEFAQKVADSRTRRTLLRRLKIGFPPEWENFYRKCYLQLQGKYNKTVKTHAREIVILPSIVGAKVGVYNGKEFVEFEIKPEMIGRRLGEFVYTTKKVQHSAPGIGASKSSKFMKAKK